MSQSNETQSPLWQWDELVAASGGHVSDMARNTHSNTTSGDAAGAAGITGISIDSRTIERGCLFVALTDQRDGHEFVSQAFAKGAGAALVSHDYQAAAGDGRLLRVDDPLAALERIGRAARARSKARIVAVTGSVGKTGSKEALRRCLSRCGKTHASEKSYNNHWGVPLTLARMPSDCAFGVFEIGMNHAGEITPLSAMVRPHVVLITTVEPVHLGFFADVTEIAEAKAEIFFGLEPGGTAVLNRDNDFYGLLKARATDKGARVLPFGTHSDAVALLVSADYGPEGSNVQALIEGTLANYRVGAPGPHLVMNSLGVLAVAKELGADVTLCAGALAQMKAQQGRGARKTLPFGDDELLLIDESYNANPASMRAALGVLATVPRRKLAAREGESRSRRIVVLGDMLELGNEARQLHRALKDVIEAADIDHVFAVGDEMQHLFADLPAVMTVGWGQQSRDIEDQVVSFLQPGDVVMVKGSLGSKMGRIVDAIISRLNAAAG